MPPSGLQIFFGSMMSNKTTTLLHQLTIAVDVGCRVLYINHSNDTRCGSGGGNGDGSNKCEGKDNVSTHSSGFHGISSKIKTIKCNMLTGLKVDDYDVIGIDEGQFFQEMIRDVVHIQPSGIVEDDLELNIIEPVQFKETPDIVAAVRHWVLDLHKMVFISSLDGDYLARPFGYVNQLICLADPGGLHKMSNARCTTCLSHGRWVPAGFTARMTNQTDVQLVGGGDIYQPMCLYCHRIHVETHEKDTL